MSFPGLDWRVLLLAAAAVLLAAGLIVVWWRRRPRDPEEIERQRRAYVNQIGRIVEGEVLEFRETHPHDLHTPKSFSLSKRNGGARVTAHHLPRNVVVYRYAISGVTYETAQDITGLEERACVETLVAGLPISVKYDPANPGNSILVADDWSGVH